MIDVTDELIRDIGEIAKKFRISQPIDETEREKMTVEQYENLSFPLVFFNITDRSIPYQISCDNGKYQYEEKIEVVLTLESRERSEAFQKIWLFLSNWKATNEYFKERKHKRKIRDIFPLQDTSFYSRNKKYYKKVIQFSYIANYELDKDFK